MHLEFSCDQMRELKTFADDLGIDFGVSPMDPVSMEEMIELRPSFIKIGSGDANNFPLIKTASESGLPVILSTGMQKQSTIQQAVGVLNDKNSVILHCISSYPTIVKNINLKQMIYLQENHVNVGYSGHELGFSPSLVAVMLGAKVVERHFTMDKQMKGSDHKCSLDPDDLKEFVRLVRKREELKNSCDVNGIRKIVQGVDFFPEITDEEFPKFIGEIMGEERGGEMYPCEEVCHEKLGKAVVYKSDRKSGEVIGECDVCIKVAKGLLPEELQSIVGKTLVCNVEKDQGVNLGHFL